MKFTGILESSGAAYVSLLTPTVEPCSVHVTVTVLHGSCNVRT